jgi:hypothetical protein
MHRPACHRGRRDNSGCCRQRWDQLCWARRAACRLKCVSIGDQQIMCYCTYCTSYMRQPNCRWHQEASQLSGFGRFTNFTSKRTRHFPSGSESFWIRVLKSLKSAGCFYGRGHDSTYGTKRWHRQFHSPRKPCAKGPVYPSWGHQIHLRFFGEEFAHA